MNRLTMMANSALRRLDQMFPGYFSGTKHNHYKDFGYPEKVTFALCYDAYRRNSLAKAVVNKTIAKSWQDTPFLQEYQRDGKGAKGKRKQEETSRERDIRQRFEDLRFWQMLAEADRRSMVGSYAGVILRLADSKPFDQPVDTVPGGLLGLVEVIPAWEGQLTVSNWDTDQRSPTYGKPKMFQFSESQVGDSTAQPRQFMVHPDRVVIWSDDETVNCTSALEAGYNDLMTIEKIVGAGGEGFWKNAKSALVLEIDKDAKIESMAKAMGVPADELADKVDEQVESWNAGFDKSLMFQGMVAKSVPVTLPSPEHFFSIAVQSFAASFSMPVKILVGMQTGERASTEDAQEWAQTNKARRADRVIPNIKAVVRRLEQFSILPERDWFIAWTDLTETSMAEKIDRVGKMVEANAKAQSSGERVFTTDEVREVVDLEPLAPDDAKVEKPDAGQDDPDKSDPKNPRNGRGGGRAADRPFVSNAKKRRLRRGRARKGYDPSQARGPDGRWVDTGKGPAPSLTSFMRSQRKQPGRHRTLDLGEVRNQAAISAAGGPNTQGWRRLVETSEVNHALKGHGRGSLKWARGDRLTRADLGKIERVVAAGQPRISRKKGGEYRLHYEVQLDGRTYNYIETVSRSRGALIFKTMWWKG